MSGTPSAGSHDHGRLEFLDAVRGLAALLVVVNHVFEHFGPPRAFFEHDLSPGAVGVTAFFIVSGFIIPVSLERQKSLGKFWAGRFFRIWPLYLLTLFVVTGWCLIAPNVAQPPHGYLDNLPHNFLVNLTTFQGALGVPSAIGAYWTLAFELAFYVVCSLLFLGRGLRRPDILLWIWVLLELRDIYHVVRDGVGQNYPLVYAPMFVAGMLTYQLVQGTMPKRPAWVAAAVGTALWLAGQLLAWPHGTPVTHSLALSYLVGAALFFGLLAVRQREFPRWLTYLGEISFSVYLIHGMIFSLGLSKNPIVNGFLVATLTAVIAPLTYRYVEKPSVALGRRLAHRPTTPPV